jgi:hypothetical protein
MGEVAPKVTERATEYKNAYSSVEKPKFSTDL